MITIGAMKRNECGYLNTFGVSNETFKDHTFKNDFVDKCKLQRNFVFG